MWRANTEGKNKNQNQSDSIYWSERQREAAIRIFNCTGCEERLYPNGWTSMLYERPCKSRFVQSFSSKNEQSTYVPDLTRAEPWHLSEESTPNVL